LVPVYLLMRKNPADQEDLDLLWTGNNPPYNIFRSTDCTNVFSSFFTTEPENAHTDTSPPPDRLVCYNVLATAPGPIVVPKRRPNPAPSGAPNGVSNDAANRAPSGAPNGASNEVPDRTPSAASSGAP